MLFILCSCICFENCAHISLSVTKNKPETSSCHTSRRFPSETLNFSRGEHWTVQVLSSGKTRVPRRVQCVSLLVGLNPWEQYKFIQSNSKRHYCVTLNNWAALTFMSEFLIQLLKWANGVGYCFIGRRFSWAFRCTGDMTVCSNSLAKGLSFFGLCICFMRSFDRGFISLFAITSVEKCLKWNVSSLICTILMIGSTKLKHRQVFIMKASVPQFSFGFTCRSYRVRILGILMISVSTVLLNDTHFV
jgi:hypothetical protein